ncbi:MAG: sulfide-dependent adenosine diphosphate thiazole synthase [Fervidicoccaceae archaeon]
MLESLITASILRDSLEDWITFSKGVDVIVVGAGPSGMAAAKYLAEKKIKVLLIERRLSVGGGIGGGGNLFHKVVLNSLAKDILEDFEIKYKKIEDSGLLVVDAVELMIRLANGVLDSGARILLGTSVEDVIVRDNPPSVHGVVTIWTSVEMSSLHVDPIFIPARATVDATGHGAEVIRALVKKNPNFGITLKGESSAYAEKSEKEVVEKTGKVIDGLYACGMSVAELYGLYRMGPIFSSMLLSGKKVAEIIARDLAV